MAIKGSNEKVVLNNVRNFAGIVVSRIKQEKEESMVFNVLDLQGD